MKRTNYTPDMLLSEFLESEISKCLNKDTGRRKKGVSKSVYEYLSDTYSYIKLNETFNLNG